MIFLSNSSSTLASILLLRATSSHSPQDLRQLPTHQIGCRCSVWPRTRILYLQVDRNHHSQETPYIVLPLGEPSMFPRQLTAATSPGLQVLLSPQPGCWHSDRSFSAPLHLTPVNQKPSSLKLPYSPRTTMGTEYTGLMITIMDY